MCQHGKTCQRLTKEDLTAFERGNTDFFFSPHPLAPLLKREGDSRNTGQVKDEIEYSLAMVLLTERSKAGKPAKPARGCVGLWEEG